MFDQHLEVFIRRIVESLQIDLQSVPPIGYGHCDRKRRIFQKAVTKISSDPREDRQLSICDRLLFHQKSVEVQVESPPRRNLYSREGLCGHRSSIVT